MKIGILAGGLGTRLSEETSVKPKPMVEIGGKPMLWHIMKTYASYGFTEFIIALGYKGEIIKDYFLNYHHYYHNLTVELKNGKVTTHDRDGENWIVHLIDTGYDTQTGGRIKQIAEFIGDEPFMLTYGDGLCNVNISSLLTFHRKNKKLATLTAVRPPARFGHLVFEGNQVLRFDEKPQVGEGWINGGFFVLQPEITNYIEGNSTYWEREPLEQLASQHQLSAYKHEEFWQCMDTLRDVHLLEKLWQEGNAPWKNWK